MMKVHSGLIEVVNSSQKSIISSSGTILNDEFVIITSNVLAPLFQVDFIEFVAAIEPSILQPPDKTFFENLHIPEIRLTYRFDNNDTVVNKKCALLASFKSQSIAHTSRNTLRNWAIDDKDNSNDLLEILSLFFVLIIDNEDTKIEKGDNLLRLRTNLNELWDEIKSIDLKKSEEIYVRSSPFGDRSLIDSYSKGIVSNYIGNESCLIVSDCPVTPGSEGSPVFEQKSNNLIGIVVSCSCWWKGDWTGLTLIVDIRSLLCQMLNIITKLNYSISDPKFGLIATIESSLLQVYSGSNWGTAIIINIEKGILITNSHVLDPKSETKIYYKGNRCNVEVIFKNADDEGLDLAVLRCDNRFLKSNNLRSLHTIKKPNLEIGDEVFCSGFPLFPREVAPAPFLSKGCISQIDNWMMMKTTCTVNPGMSGGAVLTPGGDLLGIIVCNVRIPEGTVYPRFNIALPYFLLSQVLEQFLIVGDGAVLARALSNRQDFASRWKLFRGKL